MAAFLPQVRFTTTLSTGDALRPRDSIAGLDFESRFSRTTTTTWNSHILFFSHNLPSLATLHSLSLSGWAQVCCRFGIFTHVLVLSRGPSPIPYLCTTNIGSPTLLDPSNILSVGHSKKFSLLLTALIAPIGSKILSFCGGVPKHQQASGGLGISTLLRRFHGPSNDPHHDFS